MLSNDQLFVLFLLRKSFRPESNTEQASTDSPEDVKQIVLRSGVLLTVYKELPEQLRAELKTLYAASIKQNIQQTYEGDRALEALAEAGLDCIGLKGWELQKLYPRQIARQMADLDILVSPYEFKRIKDVMDKLDFHSGSETSWKHDSFLKQNVHIEMHKRLTDDSGVIRDWEQTIWQRAIPTETAHIFRMSPEDFYVFHFVHLHKDFMNGKLGLRRVLDTWLLQRQDLDLAAARATLEGFGMGAFHDQMVKVSRAALGEAELDEDSEILLRHAFTYGIYGTEESYKAGRIAAMSHGSLQSGKVRSAVSAVFLPYSRMKAQFPVLNRWPVLLPLCWARRIARFLRGDLAHNRARLDYANISETEYQEMQRFFEAGGVKS